MSKPIRLGLIGAGGVGAYHLAALRKLEATGQVQVVSIADPSPTSRAAAYQLELADRDFPWYTDYRELLEGSTGLDLVSIATPIPFHFEMTQDALAAGVFVHLEKPPVPLIQQLETLIHLDTNYQVGVGFQMITSRCVQTLKRLIVEGELGEIRELRSTCCWPRLDNYYERASWAGRLVLDGRPVFDGPATNALAHLIHNIMYLACQDDLNGYAMPVEATGELYRARPIESYDSACLGGRFTNGARFALGVSHAAQKMLPYQIRVEGSRGWAVISHDGDRLETSHGFSMDEPETTQNLIQRCYERLVARIQERPGARVATRLVDTRPYVRTTNAMLLSSGGIHDIHAPHVRRFERGGYIGYHVEEIAEAMGRLMETGRMFSEMDLPWAVPGQTIRLDSFEHVELPQLFPHRDSSLPLAVAEA
jgi:predicted dehydrogenase